MKKTELIWVTQNSSPFFLVITSTFLVSFIYKNVLGVSEKQQKILDIKCTV